MNSSSEDGLTVTVSRPRETDGETVTGDSPTVPGDSRRQSETVDPEWVEPKWLKVFNRRELAYLAFRLDASNRTLRIVNRQLAETLNRKENQ